MKQEIVLLVKQEMVSVRGMEGGIIKAVEDLVRKANGGGPAERGDCEWCEMKGCDNWVTCKVRRDGVVRECLICGLETHPWGKCRTGRKRCVICDVDGHEESMHDRDNSFWESHCLNVNISSV